MSRPTSERHRAHRTQLRSKSLAPSPDLSFLEYPWYKGEEGSVNLRRQRRTAYACDMEDLEYSEHSESEYEEGPQWERRQEAQESFLHLVKLYSLQLAVSIAVIIFLFEIRLRTPFLLGLFFAIPSLHLTFTPGSVASKLAQGPEPEALRRRRSAAHERQAPIPGAFLVEYVEHAGWRLYGPELRKARFQPYRTWYEALSDTACSMWKTWESWMWFAWQTMMFQCTFRLAVLVARLCLAAWNNTALEWQLPETLLGYPELFTPHLGNPLRSHIVTCWIDWIVCMAKLTGIFFYFSFHFYIKWMKGLKKILILAAGFGMGWLTSALSRGESMPSYVNGPEAGMYDAFPNGGHSSHSMHHAYGASAKM